MTTSAVISRRRGWPAEKRVTQREVRERRVRRGPLARVGGAGDAPVPRAAVRHRLNRPGRAPLGDSGHRPWSAAAAENLAVSRRDRSGAVRRPTAAPNRRGSSAGRRGLELVTTGDVVVLAATLVGHRSAPLTGCPRSRP